MINWRKKWKKFHSVSEIGNSVNHEHVSRMNQTGTHEKWMPLKPSCPHWHTNEKCWLTWLIVLSCECLCRWNHPETSGWCYPSPTPEVMKDHSPWVAPAQVPWVNTHTKEATRVWITQIKFACQDGAWSIGVLSGGEERLQDWWEERWIWAARRYNKYMQ